jgi:thiosulfate/3-mercaptopyruvate sulfurtransferase
MVVDVDRVAGLRSDTTWQLLDARAPERYRGDVEPLDKVAGHIPGAANHFFQTNLDADGLFRSPEDLRAHLRATAGDHPPDHIVCYCGSGVTACHNLLALEHAGLTGAKLYPGSWSEWSSDSRRPVESGNRVID